MGVGSQVELTAGERVYRARRIGVTFGRVYLGIKAHQLIARTLRPPDMKRRWRRFNRSSARSIYDAAVELRGLILKGCQFLGSRADVLPPEYVNVLSRLQDRVPPKPFHEVQKIVETELGAPIGTIFDEFATRPIAAASLAQVHEARLRDGSRVAVKVQYPEVAALVRSDIANLRVLFRAVGVVERDLDLMPLIEELETQIPLELDFVGEGHNAERVAAHFADRADVAIPRIHWEYTTPRVLVMEYMEGIKITNLKELRAAGVDVDCVSRILVDTFCRQILAHGFFHADPHPGNLLVQPEGPRLVLLDFGLAKELPPKFREGIVALLLAMLRDRPEEAVEALLDLGFEARDADRTSLIETARFFLDLGKELREQPRLGPERIEELRKEIPARLRDNPIVRIPSHVVLLGRVLGLLSGLNRSLESQVDLIQAVFPHVLAGAGSREPE